MTSTARRSLITAFAVLSVIGLVRDCGNVQELGQTTQSSSPWGFRAFHELCERLWPTTRRIHADSGTPTSGPVWWLRPTASCGDPPDDDPVPWTLRPWIEAGGTAVVLLPVLPDGPCRLDVDLPIPSFASIPSKADQSITSPDLDRAFRVPVPLRVFAPLTDPWRSVASIAGAPLVIERPIGAGRLVILSDPRLLTNARLDAGDAGPIGAWLAARWGPPAFDDGTVGRPIAGPVAYVARSSAASVVVALALAGLLVVWHGTLLPARTIPTDDRRTPRLRDVVRSFARLLEQSRDTSGLLASQRAWAAMAMAPALGLPPHATTSAVVERLRLTRGPASAAALDDTTIPTSAAELERRFAAITSLVEEVTA